MTPGLNLARNFECHELMALFHWVSETETKGIYFVMFPQSGPNYYYTILDAESG